MSLFEAKSSGVFKDAKWLQPLCDPPGGKPLCRDYDLKFMASFLSEIFRTGQARNLFIYGKPGTGKTICVQYLLREIQNHAIETKAPVLAVYVNAGRTRTPYYTMLEIVKSLGLIVPQSGWQMFRLKRAFEDMLKDKAVVIAIDEVDSIILKEKEPLVYYLNRQPKTTLVLVSNKVEDAAQLPERALSTLQPKIIMLEPYAKEEAFKILKERAEHSFQPGVVSEKLISAVAEAASNLADIRLGFSTLLSAGLAAEKTGRTKVDADDVKSAIKSESKLDVLKKMDALKKQLEKLRKH
ncbi:MAG: Cdc6/Cdc18 family protein [Candidatus Bathycorpusculaceae bacterium]